MIAEERESDPASATPRSTEGAPGRDSVSRAPRALLWSFGNTIAGRVGTMAIGIVLARLLGPEEFGTFAVALVALTAVLAFNELGVSLAIVRWSGDPRHIAPTVATISTVTSLVIFGAAVALAPAFATAMGDPAAADVVRVLSFNVVVSGIVATPNMLMQRAFMQKRKTLIDQVSVWVGALTSLALALTGMGAMSLAVGRLAGTFISGVMFVVMSPLPFRFGWDREQVRPLLQFGLPLAGASIIIFALGYADQLIVGGMLGTTALGLYVVAANLSAWPVTVLSQPLRSVAPPVFARLKSEPEEMRSSFLALVGVLAAVVFPMCFLMAGAAEPIVRFVYGAEWAPAAAALTGLAVYAAFRILFELVYDYLVIAGTSSVILRIQTVSLIVIVPAITVGAWWQGIMGAAAVQAAAAVLLLLPLYLYQLRRVEIRVGGVLRRLVLPATVSVGAGVGGWALGQSLASDIVASVLAGLGSLLLAGVLLLLERRSLRHLRGVVTSRQSMETVW